MRGESGLWVAYIASVGMTCLAARRMGARVRGHDGCAVLPLVPENHKAEPRNLDSASLIPDNSWPAPARPPPASPPNRASADPRFSGQATR